ncbi:hypothetical protein [Bradyrhizobium sp. JYMT SZCCT0428]|uniref:hypothetical protein n=1 Tax=Bradyrhizobium sp. JYMT SZCCT0428 TaxID=2807673 RepID=UPI001BAE1718|nr:hypothetical protein [Bradyrhizobium sp. JYMT SZCCT0428]MBR1154298.1 hypothetical protein [Bradyrhizobium sp. JYMT SZCCT0428]
MERNASIFPKRTQSAACFCRISAAADSARAALSAAKFRGAIIAATLFLMGVNDMSNHAISVESTGIGVAPNAPGTR